MRNSEYRIFLDVQETRPQVQLTARPGDSLRRVRAVLFDHGLPFIQPEGSRAVMTVRLPDGTFVMADCEIYRDGTVVYDFTERVTEQEGLLDCVLEIRSALDEVVAAPKFTVLVTARTFDDGAKTAGIELAGRVDALDGAVAALQAAQEEDRRIEEELREGIAAAADGYLVTAMYNFESDYIITVDKPETEWVLDGSKRFTLRLTDGNRTVDLTVLAASKKIADRWMLVGIRPAGQAGGMDYVVGSALAQQPDYVYAPMGIDNDQHSESMNMHTKNLPDGRRLWISKPHVSASLSGIARDGQITPAAEDVYSFLPLSAEIIAETAGQTPDYTNIHNLPVQTVTYIDPDWFSAGTTGLPAGFYYLCTAGKKSQGYGVQLARGAVNGRLLKSVWVPDAGSAAGGAWGAWTSMRDETLTMQGAAADAKTVGDALYGGSDHTGKTPRVMAYWDYTTVVKNDVAAFGTTDMPRNSITMCRAGVYADAPAGIDEDSTVVVMRLGENSTGNVSRLTCFDRTTGACYTADYYESMETAATWHRIVYAEEVLKQAPLPGERFGIADIPLNSYVLTAPGRFTDLPEELDETPYAVRIERAALNDSGSRSRVTVYPSQSDTNYFVCSYSDGAETVKWTRQTDAISNSRETITSANLLFTDADDAPLNSIYRIKKSAKMEHTPYGDGYSTGGATYTGSVRSVAGYLDGTLMTYGVGSGYKTQIFISGSGEGRPDGTNLYYRVKYQAGGEGVWSPWRLVSDRAAPSASNIAIRKKLIAPFIHKETIDGETTREPVSVVLVERLTERPDAPYAVADADDPAEPAYYYVVSDSENAKKAIVTGVQYIPVLSGEETVLAPYPKTIGSYGDVAASSRAATMTLRAYKPGDHEPQDVLCPDANEQYIDDGSYFKDFNDAPLNSIYQIDRDCDAVVMANNPAPGRSSVLMTWCWSYYNVHAVVQFCVGLAPAAAGGGTFFYYRYAYRQPPVTWTPWESARATTDPLLAIAGRAADAKEVGDRLAALETRLAALEGR